MRKGHVSGAGTFKWLTRWVSGIGGWLASVVNLVIAGLLIAKGINVHEVNVAENENDSESDSVRYIHGITYRPTEKEEITYSLVSAWNIAATFIIVYEIATWFIYYIYKPGALKYANMLDEERDEYY